jgi:hypothetical protein
MMREDYAPTEFPSPSSAAILIVIALLLFCAYQVHVLAKLLVGGSSTVVLPLGVALQGASALLAAIGIIARKGWTTIALITLGASAFATSLYKGLGIGIIPWLDALTYGLAVIIGVVVCLVWLHWTRLRR